MSTHSADVAHAHGPDGAHGDDGAVHVHVSSAAHYIAIFAALICLTLLTVGQSMVDLGRFNLLAVVAIATMKAALVVTFFMHLRHDSKFNALILVSCVFFIGVFFVYTLNDTDRRSELDPDQNTRILPRTGEPAPGGIVTDDE